AATQARFAAARHRVGGSELEAFHDCSARVFDDGVDPDGSNRQRHERYQTRRQQLRRRRHRQDVEQRSGPRRSDALGSRDDRHQARGRRRAPTRSLDFTFTIPTWMGVNIQGTYADCDLQDVGGDVSIETTRGDVKVRGGSGFISLKSVQGEISLEKAKGKIEVRN